MTPTDWLNEAFAEDARKATQNETRRNEKPLEGFSIVIPPREVRSSGGDLTTLCRNHDVNLRFGPSSVHWGDFDSAISMLAVICPTEDVSTEELTNRMRREGLYPANAQELVHFPRPSSMSLLADIRSGTSGSLSYIILEPTADDQPLLSDTPLFPSAQFHPDDHILVRVGSDALERIRASTTP